MNSRETLSLFFIGWDVGGWNCDRNANSRDAIVILDSERCVSGTPWRGNLRELINACPDTCSFIHRLVALCGADAPPKTQVTLAIDTPLGFSTEFLQLISNLKYADDVGDSNTNRYLFRRTERFLFENGLRPLSAVKDMIGSQATKGMHVLAKFAPNVKSCGVWEDGESLTAIEAYPSACRGSECISRLRETVSDWPYDDRDDRTHALTCALVAYLFAEHRAQLRSPDVDIPKGEGWIWVPKDVLGRRPQ